MDEELIDSIESKGGHCSRSFLSLLLMTTSRGRGERGGDGPQSSTQQGSW